MRYNFKTIKLTKIATYENVKRGVYLLEFL